ncbi:MAG TPA: cytochrome c biogenesis protein CcsA, partial [Phycisphaerae bacterium]|nr:cytochrome c biogenesis protein CcsA [Phycisphaerae bacterium]
GPAPPGKRDGGHAMIAALALKPTPLGALMLTALALHVLALPAWAVRRAMGQAVFAAGFVAAAAAVVLRATQTGQPPMQNLFEVFLLLGALMFPLSVLSRRALGVGAEAIDAALAAAMLFGPAMIFSDAAQPLPPALQSPLFVPHVAAYLLAYVILAKAAALAAALVVAGDRAGEGKLVSRAQAVRTLVRAALPLLTAGLLLGAVWGKLAWGDWWNWDPKELWSLASWLAFVAYLHVPPGAAARRPRLVGAIVVLGAALILITLLWANLAQRFAGLHSYA